MHKKSMRRTLSQLICAFAGVVTLRHAFCSWTSAVAILIRRCFVHESRCFVLQGSCALDGRKGEWAKQAAGTGRVRKSFASLWSIGGFDDSNRFIRRRPEQEIQTDGVVGALCGLRNLGDCVFVGG